MQSISCWYNYRFSVPFGSPGWLCKPWFCNDNKLLCVLRDFDKLGRYQVFGLYTGIQFYFAPLTTKIHREQLLGVFEHLLRLHRQKTIFSVFFRAFSIVVRPGEGVRMALKIDFFNFKPPPRRVRAQSSPKECRKRSAWISSFQNFWNYWKIIIMKKVRNKYMFIFFWGVENAHICVYSPCMSLICAFSALKKR